MRRSSTLFLSCLLLNLVACDQADDPTANTQLAALVNEDLDLEGYPCEYDPANTDPNGYTYRLCAGGEGVQFCGQDWNACEMGDDCVAGEQSEEPAYSDELCGDMYYQCHSYEGVNKWFLPESNTPLVLRFDDAPVLYSTYTGDDAIAAFSVGGNECTSSDWPTAATPWLALDRDGNGKIEGGAELFGSGTMLSSGYHAQQGFEALSELDDNHDGKVDAKDANFSQLLLWADHDGDRRSDAGELSKLSDNQVQSLSVEYDSEVSCDERGNCGRERAGFEFSAQGASRVGEIVDVYLPCR